MMNVNTVASAQGAQSAQSAEAMNAADAALFQNLVAAALLQKGGTLLQKTAVLAEEAGIADAAESADLGLLVKLLLGGGVFAAESAAESDALSQETLLRAIAAAPAEELLAASGRPEIAETAETLADAGAILDALAAAGAQASAADGDVNSAAVETLLSGALAAETPLYATLARELQPLLTADAAETGLLGTAQLAQRAKALRVEVPQDGDAQRAAAETNAAIKALGAEASADGEAANAAAALETVGGDAFAERGAAQSFGKVAEAVEVAGAATAQDGIAAAGPEAGARPAAQPQQTAAKAEPYSQIARELFAAITNKQVPTTFSMRLEPAELGKIDVSMRLTAAGKLVIGIAAESAKTQALLAGQTDKLVQALGLQNVQIESVSANIGAAFQGQQSAYAYGDRSMAFFMDLAHGGDPGERTDPGGKEQRSEDGRTVAGIPAEETAPEALRYARRLDLTA
jgi:hypothetical protein